MVGDTENIVLLLLREIRKEQSEQRSLLLEAVDQLRRMDADIHRIGGDMRRLEEG